MKVFGLRQLAPEIGLLLFVGVFAWGAALAPSGTAPFPISLEARGRQIFQREGCMFCHSLQGYQPAPQPVSRNLGYLRRVGTGWSRNGPDLTLEPGKRTDDWHLAHLLNPSAVSPSCPMPSYAGLPDDELQALIAFLQTPRDVMPPPPSRAEPSSLEQKEVPSVPPTRASYLAGRKIYRVYCAGCHGMEGNGAGPAGHLLWPEPRDFTDTAWMSKRSQAYLLNVISRGKPGTAMPGYDGWLSAEEQALVLYYLKFYPNPSARQSLEEGFVVAGAK